MLEPAGEERISPICERAAAHRLVPRDLVQLELLRQGLDQISAPAWWGEEVT